MSHLSIRKPNPVDVFELDPFDQAFLIYTGNLKLINPLVTVAEVLKASGDLILWGPQAALLFRVLDNGWRDAGGNDYTEDVVNAFDTDADPVTVDLKRVSNLLENGQTLGNRHWRLIKDKIPEILFETQYRSQVFYDRKTKEFDDRINDNRSTSPTVFTAEVGKSETKIIKVSRSNFDQWFELQSPETIENYVRNFPPEVLNPRIADLARQASLKEGVRALDRAELIRRIDNIPSIPHAAFDRTGDVEIARAWNKTAVAMMQGYAVSDYQIISERDKRTCPVCQQIDGRVFSAQRAIEKMAEYDAIDPGNVQAIRDLWSFPRQPDVDNLPPADVYQLDLVPPFHPRCRCEVVLLHTRFSGGYSFDTSNATNMPYQERLLFRDRYMKNWNRHKDKAKQNAYRLLGNKKGRFAVSQHGENICVADYSIHKSGVTVKAFYNFGRAQDRTVIQKLAQMAKDKKGYLRVTPATAREVKFLERIGFSEVGKAKVYQAKSTALDDIIKGRTKRKKKPAKITPAEKVQPTTMTAVDDYEKNLLAAEKEIADLPKERALIIDKDGNVIESIDGTRSGVNFTEDQAKSVKGLTLSHNHPSASSFSFDDVMFMTSTEMRSIRAVSRSHRHEMSIQWNAAEVKKLRTGAVDANMALREKIAEKVRKWDDVISLEFRQKIKNGQMTVVEANRRHWHEVWTSVSNELKWLKYERKNWFLSVNDTYASKSVFIPKKILNANKGDVVIDIGTLPKKAIKPLGGGVNETQIVTLSNGKKAVFKPVKGEKFGLRQSITNDAATLANREALASEIDTYLGLDLVPETRLVRINGEVGSLQYFRSDAVAQFDWTGGQLADKDLYRSSIFDFLIGNTDRHNGNFMRLNRGRNKGKFVAIDHGYTFTSGNDVTDMFGLGEFRCGPAADPRAGQAAFNGYLSKTEKQKIIDRLNALDVDQLGLKYNLDRDEITRLEKRRDLLLQSMKTDTTHQLFLNYRGYEGNYNQAEQLYNKIMF